MLGQAAQAPISYLKLPQGNSCFPDVCPFSELEQLYHLDHSDIQVGHHIQILPDAKNEVSHAQAGEM